MRGLLLQLSALDQGAESAVRIIAFFDGLTKNRADFDALARAAAGLASCAAGVRDREGNVLAYYDEKGRRVSALPAVDGQLDRSFGNAQAGGAVWLERREGSGALDEMILERMAVSADIILDRQRRIDSSGRDDVSLLRTMINGRARDVDRIDAARALGLRGDAIPACLHLSSNEDQRARVVGQVLEHDLGRPVRSAVVDSATCCLMVDGTASELVGKSLVRALGSGEYAGIGSATAAGSAHVAWRQASQAARLARAGIAEPVALADELGGRLLLAALPPAELDAPDVRALSTLVRGSSGSDVLRTLDALIAHGSARKVATLLHMHHSSIGYRIDRAEAALGFALTTQDGLFRLRLAVEMWKLAGLDRNAPG